mgnify:CR=1 FL=1
MSKKIECRLPDDLYKNLKEYASKQGVTVTDIVIAGINSQIYGLPGKAKNPPSNDKPVSEIVQSGASGETVYEPDPVKLPKAPKISASKTVSPIVSQLLAGISKQVLVAHALNCPCAMCKPTPIK